MCCAQVLSEMKKKWKHCKINKNGSWNPCLKVTSISPHHHPRLLVTEDQQTQVQTCCDVVTNLQCDKIIMYLFICLRVYINELFFRFRGREAYRCCLERIRRNVYRMFNSRNAKTRLNIFIILLIYLFFFYKIYKL